MEWTASVRSPDNGSAERLLSAGMVARLMWRGARPSIETISTGEGETVVTVMIRLREPPTKQPGGRVCCGGVGCVGFCGSRCVRDVSRFVGEVEAVELLEGLPAGFEP